jgi:hypothetical protein
MQSDADPPVTEEPVEPTEVVTPRVKVPRTPKQLAALESARVKAMAARAEKAELRRKEKEVLRAQTDAAKQDRAARIQAEYDALHAVKEEEVEEEVEEERVVKKAARKPARRIIVHEVSSASEEEDDTVDVIVPKAKRGPTPQEVALERVRNKMFSIG